MLFINNLEVYKPTTRWSTSFLGTRELLSLGCEWIYFLHMLFRKLLPGTIGGPELAPFTEHLGYIPSDLLHPPHIVIYSTLFYSILLYFWTSINCLCTTDTPAVLLSHSCSPGRRNCPIDFQGNTFIKSLANFPFLLFPLLVDASKLSSQTGKKRKCLQNRRVVLVCYFSSYSHNNFSHSWFSLIGRAAPANHIPAIAHRGSAGGGGKLTRRYRRFSHGETVNYQ